MAQRSEQYWGLVALHIEETEYSGPAQHLSGGTRSFSSKNMSYHELSMLLYIEVPIF